MLGELIDLVSGIAMHEEGAKAKDVLGRVYEYFLGSFAGSEGKRGGEFYTPRSVVRVLVEMLEPYKGRVYDPCCGSGGMFVQSEKFVEGHGGRIGDIAIYGQESNYTTWRLAKMNLAVRGIDADIRWNNEGSFHKDELKDLRFDYILANPPFNISDWGGDRLREDGRWKYGVPPVGNANYAWLQHILWHLVPDRHGGRGSRQWLHVLDAKRRRRHPPRYGRRRRGGLHDCAAGSAFLLHPDSGLPVVSVAEQSQSRASVTGAVRFSSLTPASSATWWIAPDANFRTRTSTEIAATYHAWRGEKDAGEYEDVPGFCKAAKLDDIKGHNYVLTPGRYVGAADVEDDDVPFPDRFAELRTKLTERFAESDVIEAQINHLLTRIAV